jgi:hypothetical protein
MNYNHLTSWRHWNIVRIGRIIPQINKTCIFPGLGVGGMNQMVKYHNSSEPVWMSYAGLLFLAASVDWLDTARLKIKLCWSCWSYITRCQDGGGLPFLKISTILGEELASILNRSDSRLASENQGLISTSMFVRWSSHRRTFWKRASAISGGVALVAFLGVKWWLSFQTVMFVRKVLEMRRKDITDHQCIKTWQNHT